jgi:4-amino-4-deoxy-L-arabinose transferase-like glycosyltransferase
VAQEAAGAVTLSDRRRAFYALALLAAFVVSRALGWATAPVLEEHDSATYLQEARALAQAPLRGLVELSPDSSPLFPWLTALVGFITPSLEAAARLVSLAFSLLAVVVVVACARFTGDTRGAWIGAGLLVFAPLAIGFSYSILSEPIYVGLVLAGWWLTLLGSERRGAGLAAAAGAGALFGCAFLARFEGIMYLGLAPAAILAGALVRRERFSELPRRYAPWIGTMIVAFTVVAAPQIARVSEALGTFALNGRELWWDILHVDDGRSYDQKLYGLDHSPSEINLTYLQKHPEARPVATEQASLAENLEIWVDNWLRFYSTELGMLFGPVALGLFLAGLVALAAARRWAFLAQTALFLGAGVGVPMLATALPRHFLVVMPIVLLVAGSGARWLGEHLAAAVNHPRFAPRTAAVALALFGIVLWAPLHAKIYLRPDPPFQPSDYAGAVAEITSWREAHGGAVPVLAARQRYLAYLTRSEHLPLPYTDLPGLLGYLRANRARFLFLEMRAAEDQPFLDALLADDAPSELALRYRGRDAWGQELRLFAVGNAEATAMAGARESCPRGAVVMVHGLGQGPEIFDSLKSHLVSRGHAAHCLRAVTFSPNDGSNIEAAETTLTAAVQTILDDAGPKQSGGSCSKVHLVAHSMGALAARWYAARVRPEAVASLITTSGANHGTQWRCDSPMGPGHVEMCPAFARSAAESRVQFTLNGAPGPDVDETPWGTGTDSASVRSVSPDTTRRIVYATLRSPGDPFIVPESSLSLDGAGGFGAVPRVTGVTESSPGNFVIDAAPGHDALLESPAAMERIATLIEASGAEPCGP